MRKWLEYQFEHQRRPNYSNIYSVSPITNLAEHMGDTMSWVKSLYNTPRVTQRIESIFSRQGGYVDALAPNVIGVDKPTLESWIYDPDYAELLERPSNETVYFHEPADFDRILKEFCQGIGVKRYTSKGLTSVKINVQHPGQMFPLHIDRAQHYDFNKDFSNSQCHQRYFFFLDDQAPGQVFQVDHAYLTWKRGDVFSYDAHNDMHGSANFGFCPRFLMLITIITDND